MNIVEFREFGWYSSTIVRFSLPSEYEYDEKQTTFTIEFRRIEIEDICKQIKDVLQLFKIEDVKYSTSKEMWNRINKRDLNSSKTIYDLFAQYGIQIESGVL